MRYGTISSFQTGVAIPIFSLRSADSVGIGDFLDLVPMADFAHAAGFDLIQLLPINDTGEESSPYSARSAFALNPVYIRLQNVPGVKPFLEQIQKQKDDYDAFDRIQYVDVVRFKRHILLQIFQNSWSKIQKNDEFNHWIQENDWVISYSVYCMLKAKENEASWTQWKSHQNPKPSTIKSLWNKNPEECLYQAWMQWIAEQQLLQALTILNAHNIKLKGDIPILINEDSCDVWAQREFFDLTNRAGAPPDMFSYSGQNWGFPTYRWETLESMDYQWWRQRLSQAAKFYHAYRIDHVLGFFRIWTVPSSEETGILGHFCPAHPITKSQLHQAGIPQQTVEYLTHPNVGTEWLESLFEVQTPKVLKQYFKEIEPGRWKLKKEYYSERAILDSNPEPHIKDALLRVYWNRVFIPTSQNDEIYPYWYWYQSEVLKTLPYHEQEALRNLINTNEASQESLWYETGLKLLKVMSEETDMLVCAEDLGVIPDCVPVVLDKLKILSLRIERWARDWKAEGQPYIPPNQYPRLSVATISVHDTSTLQGLWEEPDFDRDDYWRSIGMAGKAPQQLNSDIAFLLMDHIMQGNSLLVLPSLQDYLAISPHRASRNPQQDRVNIPGTVGPHNWSWRIPTLIEELIDDDDFIARIRRLVDRRKQRLLWTH